MHRAMRQCQRKMAFAHLVAHHAAKKDQFRREAFILKQLQHIPAWQGHIVHRVLAGDFLNMIRSRGEFNWLKLVELAQGMARRQFAFSAARRYRTEGLTKSSNGDQFAALYGHEYGPPPDSFALEMVCAEFAHIFTNLRSQENFLEKIRRGYNHRAESNLFFRLKNFSPIVTAKPDLTFDLPGSKIVVIDWKLGNRLERENSRQLQLYGLVVMRCGWWRDVSPSQIELAEVNLTRNVVEYHSFDQSTVDETEDFL